MHLNNNNNNNNNNIIGQGKQGKLVKWSSEDGEYYDESFNEKMFNDEIGELQGLVYDVIYEVI